jgi:hypothetical protein
MIDIFDQKDLSQETQSICPFFCLDRQLHSKEGVSLGHGCFCTVDDI